MTSHLTPDDPSHAGSKAMPQNLTDEQHDGLACVVCGREPHELIPIPGLISKYDCQVFRCGECRPNAEAIRRKIIQDAEAVE